MFTKQRIRQGEIYLLDLQPSWLICPFCKMQFSPDLICPNCGKNISTSQVQTGKRPVIVIQRDGLNNLFETILIVPLTSNLKALRFKGAVEILADKQNGLRADSAALVFQLRVVSKNLFSQQQRVGKVSDDILNQVIEQVNSFIC